MHGIGDTPIPHWKLICRIAGVPPNAKNNIPSVEHKDHANEDRNDRHVSVGPAADVIGDGRQIVRRGFVIFRQDDLVLRPGETLGGASAVYTDTGGNAEKKREDDRVHQGPVWTMQKTRTHVRGFSYLWNLQNARKICPAKQ